MRRDSNIASYCPRRHVNASLAQLLLRASLASCLLDEGISFGHRRECVPPKLFRGRCLGARYCYLLLRAFSARRVRRLQIGGLVIRRWESEDTQGARKAQSRHGSAIKAPAKEALVHSTDP